MSNKIKIFWIDLFCGAGGTTTGVHLANSGKDIHTEVVACVNHDENAIKSHYENHPDCIHYTEDIRDFAVVKKLAKLVKKLRLENPGCLINIWASLECTNFSKAKGGMPRDADSRTLADHIFMYIEELDPDYLWIENVVEFMSWGPLDDKGKPESRKRGKDYLRWIDQIRDYGYKFDWRELNSADFGAYTARNRYFAQFPKKGLPISWPVKTHTKNPAKETGFFDNPLKPWKPVKEVLNLENEGKSIFNRKKPLVDNTLKRIYAGLVKFVANGDDSFLKKYYSGRPMGKVISVNGPAGTVKTADGHAYVKCSFLSQSNGGNPKAKNWSVDGPNRTVTSSPNHAIINSCFLQSYYGNGQAHSENEPCPTVSTRDRFGKIQADFLVDYQYKSNSHSIDKPAPTLLTKDKFAKVNYLMMNYSNSQSRDIDTPAATIVNNDKHNLITAEPWLMDTSFNNKGKSIEEPAPTILASRKHHYIMNPSFKCAGHSVEKPAPTVIARQDKKPLGLIACERGEGFYIPIYKDDSEIMVKIKVFMAHFGIVDIKMRMLVVEELLKIQGFPEGYKLVGTQTDQKKFIGNSVEVKTAKSLVSANYKAIVEHFKFAA